MSVTLRIGVQIKVRPDEGPFRGPDKGPFRGPNKGPFRGPDKDPFRGSREGSLGFVDTRGCP